MDPPRRPGRQAGRGPKGGRGRRDWQGPGPGRGPRGPPGTGSFYGPGPGHSHGPRPSPLQGYPAFPLSPHFQRPMPAPAGMWGQGAAYPPAGPPPVHYPEPMGYDYWGSGGAVQAHPWTQGQLPTAPAAQYLPNTAAAAAPLQQYYAQQEAFQEVPAEMPPLPQELQAPAEAVSRGFPPPPPQDTGGGTEVDASKAESVDLGLPVPQGKASNELEKEAEKSSNARQSETAATASPAAAPTIGLDSLKLTPSKQEQGEKKPSEDETAAETSEQNMKVQAFSGFSLAKKPVLVSANNFRRQVAKAAAEAKQQSGIPKAQAEDGSAAPSQGANPIKTADTSIPPSESVEAALISPVPLPVAEQRPLSGRRLRKSKWGQDIGPSSPGEPSSPVEETLIAQPSSPKALDVQPEEKSSKTRKRREKWEKQRQREEKGAQMKEQRSPLSPQSPQSSSRGSSSSSSQSSRSHSASSRSSGSSGSTSSSGRYRSPPAAPRGGRSESQSPFRRGYDPPNAPRREYRDYDGGRREPSYERDRSAPMLMRRWDDRRDRYRSDDRGRPRRSPSRERYPERYPRLQRHAGSPRRDRDRDYGRDHNRSQHYSRDRRSPSPRLRPYPMERRRSSPGRQRQKQVSQQLKGASPEEGEVRVASPKSTSKARSETPPAMDVFELSPRHSWEARHSDRDVMPPLPAEPMLGLAPPLPNRQGPGLAEQEKQLEARCQAVLDGIFSSHGLDRSAESDPFKKGQMAARLLGYAAYKGSQNLVLTFDSYLGEENPNPQRDDVSCLGDPEALGFPSWIPSALTTVQTADTSDFQPWTLVARTQQIPLEAALQLSDPRLDSEQESGRACPSQKLPLALPSFALLPAKVAKAEESEGYSWSEAPYEAVEDDAFSTDPTAVPPPPPPEEIGQPDSSSPPPWLQQLAEAAPAVPAMPLIKPQGSHPPPQATTRDASGSNHARPSSQRLHSQLEQSKEWLTIDSRSAFVDHGNQLQHLRLQMKLRLDPHLCQGVCVHRPSDNLWLPLTKEEVSEEDLVWKGRALAAKIGEPCRSASFADSPDAALREVCCRNLAIEAGLDAVVADQGVTRPQTYPADAALSDLSNEELLAWMEGHPSSHADSVGKTSAACQSLPMSIEKSGVPWGPTPPPHVGAMLKGRLALRALGGREGEILATKVIEEAFLAVMAKEPARQEALRLQKEAEAVKQKAAARASAEEDKRREERRRQQRAEKERSEAEQHEKRRRKHDEDRRERSRHHSREPDRRSHQYSDRHRSRDPDGRRSREPERHRTSEPDRQRTHEANRRRSREPESRHARDGDGHKRSRTEPETLESERPKLRRSNPPEDRALPLKELESQSQRRGDINSGQDLPPWPEKALPEEKANKRDRPVNGEAINHEDPAPQVSPPIPDSLDPPPANPVVPPDASRGASKPGSDSDPELSSESSPEAVKKQPSKKRGRPAREAPRADDLDDDYDPDRAKASTKKRQRPAASTNGVKKQDAAAGASSKKPRQSNEDKKDEVADGTQDKQEEVRALLIKKAIPDTLQEMWRLLQKYDREHLRSLFADPVDKKEYPQYQDHIKEPMDLKTLGKRLVKLPADASGLQAFKDAVELMGKNALTFASVLDDVDLDRSAALFREKAEAVYQQGMRKLESYGNSAMRGH